MNYEITQKNDLNRGAQLVLSFPEEELDPKAFYTLQQDFPDFLVPFHTRLVDGRVECTYQLDSRTKLEYRFGQYLPQQYIDLWERVLRPLIDCGDWFLTPLSFVTDLSFLYVDREGAVSYLYIPSRRPWGGPDALFQMASELCRRNSVTDSRLENQVFRVVVPGFRPQELLAALRDYQAPKLRAAQAPAEPAAPARPPEPPAPAQPPQPAGQPPRRTPLEDRDPDEIFIDLSGGQEKRQKKEKERKKSRWFSWGREKKEDAPPPEQRVCLGVGGGESPQWTPPAPAPAPSAPPRPAEGPDTELFEEEGDACLRLVGDPGLPRIIQVTAAAGRPFTIGRFDVEVGRKQSDFEFEKRTKEVSRRHAAIERGADGYVLVDLASRAGTYVNGERLVPNVPRALRRGDRVCFGSAGADYIWEA